MIKKEKREKLYVSTELQKKKRNEIKLLQRKYVNDLVYILLTDH